MIELSSQSFKDFVSATVEVVTDLVTVWPGSRNPEEIIKAVKKLRMMLVLEIFMLAALISVFSMDQQSELRQVQKPKAFEDEKYLHRVVKYQNSTYHMQDLESNQEVIQKLIKSADAQKSKEQSIRTSQRNQSQSLISEQQQKFNEKLTIAIRSHPDIKIIEDSIKQPLQTSDSFEDQFQDYFKMTVLLKEITYFYSKNATTESNSWKCSIKQYISSQLCYLHLHDFLEGQAPSWESVGKSLTVYPESPSMMKDPYTEDFFHFSLRFVILEFPPNIEDQQIQFIGYYCVKYTEQNGTVHYQRKQLQLINYNLKVSEEERVKNRPIKRNLLCENLACSRNIVLLRMNTEYPIRLTGFKVYAVKDEWVPPSQQEDERLTEKLENSQKLLNQTKHKTQKL